MIIGNVRGPGYMLPDPDWKADVQQEAQARTSWGTTIMMTGGDMPSWMFKDGSNREETKNIDSKKKPTQPEKNDNRARQVGKVQEGATEETCAARPALTRAQAK